MTIIIIDKTKDIISDSELIGSYNTLMHEPIINCKNVIIITLSKNLQQLKREFKMNLQHLELEFYFLTVKKVIRIIPYAIDDIIRRVTNIAEFQSKNFDLKQGKQLSYSLNVKSLPIEMLYNNLKYYIFPFISCISQRVFSRTFGKFNRIMGDNAINWFVKIKF